MSKSTELLEEQISTLLEQLVRYNDAPTKAESKRIRMGLGAIKKNTASIRQELVALDSKGY